jgi:hypothetical protein
VRIERRIVGSWVMGKEKSDTPHTADAQAQHMTDKRHDRRALARIYSPSREWTGDQETPKAGQVSLSAAALLVHDDGLRPESGLDDDGRRLSTQSSARCDIPVIATARNSPMMTL